MPELYKYLFIGLIIWNILYLSGLMKIEKQKKNYFGVLGISVLEILSIALFSLNFYKF